MKTPTNPDAQEGPATPTEPTHPATKPPAAAVVLAGKKSEKDPALARKVKERETRIAELEDENRRLKTPAPKGDSVTAAHTFPAKAPEKASWLKGATFFDEE
jgi:hypothetical protein